MGGGGKHILSILRKGKFKNFFWRGKELMDKGWPIFGGEAQRFLEIAIIPFTSRLLFDLLFKVDCKMFFTYFSVIFSLFRFTKSFSNSVLFY